MKTLPTGTVTFLFTDIEGSTKLVQALGDGYRQLLDEHCRILRAAIDRGGGTEVGTEGDSFFAAFPTATGAVEAAADAQRGLAEASWPKDVEVRVRMGLHTGSAMLGGENYIGLDVHRAARIAAAAHGGQVLLSDATKAVIGGAGGGIAFRDLGSHRLKDLANAERIFQLDVPGLASDFPTIRSLDARPNNLPVQLTSFVGREAQLAAVGELLDKARLVTLTGPGGTGKTRLALQVAAERLGRYRDGAFFVELAPVSDPGLVLSAVASALAIREATDRPLVDTVKEWLRDREVLIVLDNFEQVLDAAPNVTDLIGASPALRMIVTSRAPLHVHGEHEFAVPPLAIPDPAHLPRFDSLSAFEAVALFLERAMAARPSFVVTRENAPALAEIVARLDGLPLAIELAAAKVRLFGPEAILGRLGSRLAFLGDGPRDLPARQQTLRAAVEWSYDLLEPADQSRLRCLGVFVGGFSLEAAAAVCSPDAGDPEAGLLTLVDQSLVRREEGEHGEPRFAMLETIREFALDSLAKAGELADARRRHATRLLAFAEGLEPQLTTSREVVDALAHDHDNVRAALAWAVEVGNGELGLRLGYAMWRFWQLRGHLREGREWFERLLALPAADSPPPARAKGLTGAAGIAYWQNDYDAAAAWYAEAEAIVRDLGDRAWLSDAVYNSGTTAAVRGDMATVTTKLDEGRRIGRELGDEAIIRRFLEAEGYMAFMSDDLEHAREALEEAHRLVLGTGDRFAIGMSHHTVAQVARLQGRFDDAAAHYREALTLGRELGDQAGLSEPLQGLAAVAIARGEDELGVRLLAANAALRERLGGGPPPEWLRLGDPLADARGRIGDAAYERAWAAGLELSTEAAVEAALGRPARA